MPPIEVFSKLYRSDPLADRTIAVMVGNWPATQTDLPEQALARLARVSRWMDGWDANGVLPTWRPADATEADAPMVEALQGFLRDACALPQWADAAMIQRAERVFMDEGPTSCMLLFCASLPECYVLPRLAQVLHITGQLEAHTTHRIRQTAAMIFPVMMPGGLTDSQGFGVAQILKVRLIHAMIRHLILRGNPQTATRSVERACFSHADATAPTGWFGALATHGWDVQTWGLPCNQLELTYTLLTFSHVFLRGMRTLGLHLSEDEERAYMHAWNVVGYLLGIDEDLMVWNFDDGRRRFEQLRRVGCNLTVTPDVRPCLGMALQRALADAIRVPVLRQIPVPLTCKLIGTDAARTIGFPEPSRLVRGGFAMGWATTRAVDFVARRFIPEFSLSRMFTRALGYHTLSHWLLDQTRPLAIPQRVLASVHEAISVWHDERRAPRWMNRLEDRLTVRGPWTVREVAPVRSTKPGGPA